MSISEMLQLEKFQWRNTTKVVPAIQYFCGYCGHQVGSEQCFFAGQDTYNGDEPGTEPLIHAVICPVCKGLTIMTGAGEQFPRNAPGNPIKHLPDDLAKLYEEARLCAGAGAYTGSVMICRKILMNLAIEEGAREDLSFVDYVDYLTKKVIIPQRARGWIDHIRRCGNEATHELAAMSADDATRLLSFVELLLKALHEYPNMVPVRP